MCVCVCVCVCKMKTFEVSASSWIFKTTYTFYLHIRSEEVL